MPSYQSPTPAGDPTGRWLTFSAAVAVSAATRDWLAGKIIQRRRKIRSRWRLLDPTTQAAKNPVLHQLGVTLAAPIGLGHALASNDAIVGVQPFV